MPRVRFTADFDFKPEGRPQVTIAYKAGTEKVVTRACADVAVRRGAAVWVTQAVRQAEESA